MLWYFSTDSPPQDLKQRKVTFQCRETEEKGRETETRRKGKGEMKTREKEGEWEKERRIDKVRDVDRNDENVRVLTCFPQQEGSKTRGKGTASDGRREEGIVGGGE